MTKTEKYELQHKKRIDREVLRSTKRKNKLKYQAERYKVGRVSSASKIITLIVIAVYIVTIICGIHLMYKFMDTTQIYALFASVTAPAATTIFIFVKKNTFENTKGGITYDATMEKLHQNDENIDNESEVEEFISEEQGGIE